MKRGIEDYAKETIRTLVPGVQDAGFLRTILEACWREDSADDEVIGDNSGRVRVNDCPPQVKTVPRCMR
jgi:hypothetical protein